VAASDEIEIKVAPSDTPNCGQGGVAGRTGGGGCRRRWSAGHAAEPRGRQKV